MSRRTPDVSDGTTFRRYRVADDRRYVRNPLDLGDSRRSYQFMFASLHSILFGMGIFVVPGWYLHRSFRWQFTLRHFLLFVPVVAGVIVTLGLSPLPIWSGSADVWSRLTYAAWGASLLVAICEIARALIQHRWKQTVLMLGLAFLAMVVYVGFPFLPVKWGNPNLRLELPWYALLQLALMGGHLFGAVVIVMGVFRWGIHGVSRLVPRRGSIASP